MRPAPPAPSPHRCPALSKPAPPPRNTASPVPALHWWMRWSPDAQRVTVSRHRLEVCGLLGSGRVQGPLNHSGQYPQGRASQRPQDWDSELLCSPCVPGKGCPCREPRAGSSSRPPPSGHRHFLQVCFSTSSAVPRDTGQPDTPVSCLRALLQPRRDSLAEVAQPQVTERNGLRWHSPIP